MAEPIVVVDSSTILEGKLDELRTVVKELVEFVDANEPRPIFYSVFFSEDGSRMTVVQVHPDSESMEFHMEIAGSAFPQFKNFLQMSTMDIYGRPNAKLLEQLHQKAQMLGASGVRVHDFRAGFSRFRLR